jgi:hypothetical protein
MRNMKFPYGVSDFQKIIEEHYFYVDRTDRIPLIEGAGDQLFFLRPRRLGKSLLVSMLENYYDVAKAERFESLFGHLAIGKNPTALHNKYLILKWDFSAIAPQGNTEQIRRALYNYINQSIKELTAYYKKLLTDEPDINPDDAQASFLSLLALIRLSPYKLYLLIDEYDNFANEIMMGGQPDSKDRYKALLYGEGLIKSLFKLIKSSAAGGGLDRVFFTGVSPIVLADITSGYNIAEDISSDKEFSDLCGFRDSETADTLDQIASECDYSHEETEEALTMVRTFYDGYCFSYHTDTRVYNPTLAIYFFKKFQKYCEYPLNMLDSNLSTDRNKLRYISRIPYGDELIIQTLTVGTVSVPLLSNSFGIEDMLTMNKDTIFMASLLYYFGVLTLGQKNMLNEFMLHIPNLVVRKLYAEEIKNMFFPDISIREDSTRAAQALYLNGQIQPLCDFIESRYFKVYDNRDYRWANELTVKTAFLTLLFNDIHYIMDSETALEKKYADLTMILRPDARQSQLLDILIEFKFVSLSDAGLTAEKAQSLSIEELKAIPLVKEKLSQSRTQLADYREILEKKYGESLRLHCYGVASVGFERLVWEEV